MYILAQCAFCTSIKLPVDVDTLTMPHVDHTLSNEDTEIPQVRRKLQTKETHPL